MPNLEREDASQGTCRIDDVWTVESIATNTNLQLNDGERASIRAVLSNRERLAAKVYAFESAPAQTPLEREDLAAFVALWGRTMVPVGFVTASTLKVLAVLSALAAQGGVLTVPATDVLEQDEQVVSER